MLSQQTASAAPHRARRFRCRTAEFVEASVAAAPLGRSRDAGSGASGRIPDMAWDFSTEPEFQKKLDWVEEFCREEVEPLEYVFPYAVRSPDPHVKAYVRSLQQHIKDQ